MTPEKLEDLKKIQPLFTEWEVGMRGWDILAEQECFYIANNTVNPKFISNGTYVYSLGNIAGRFLHYPHPHQMWEKVDWRRFEMRKITIDGELWLRPVNEHYGWNSNLETALLKALIQQEGL